MWGGGTFILDKDCGEEGLHQTRTGGGGGGDIYTRQGLGRGRFTLDKDWGGGGGRVGLHHDKGCGSGSFTPDKDCRVNGEWGDKHAHTGMARRAL